MNEKRKELVLRRAQTLLVGRDPAKPFTQKPTAKVIPNSHQVVRQMATETFGKSEFLEFLANENISRGVRMAAIASSNNLDLLISVATVVSTPMFIRKNALQRIDQICAGTPLERKALRRLIPCLREKDLIAFAIVIMDMADYDWCAHCNEGTVDIFFIALSECRCIHETILLEDYIAQLAYRRHDLKRALQSHDLEKLLMESTHAPTDPNNILFPDFSPEKIIA